MDLIAEIDARIEKRRLLDHTFYTRWAEGTLPMEAMQEYARQYYAFESTFPRYLSALHSRTEDRTARQAILDNLWDEEHGEENHAELWLRFAEGIGVDRDDVTSAEPNEATRDLLETYRRASTERPVAAGVAAMYAYERQVPGVAVSKIDGLARNYGVDDTRTTAFFKVHSTLDEEHAAAEASIAETHGAGHEDEVVETAQDALDAWWRFLDAVNV
ncbi:MAG TPA: CADD family putative folate metabolism protein [Actinomycetota bacterium]|jgi:pyrroloquinoline-quinone synthase|nr:CADD family putative folate metabolism protein [Actinomycetota bacterium]